MLRQCNRKVGEKYTISGGTLCLQAKNHVDGDTVVVVATTGTVFNRKE